MVYVALEHSYPTPKPRADGWTPEWRRWFAAGSKPHISVDRGESIRRAVRAALKTLGYAERTIIELYFYDGLSWGDIADRLRLPASSVRVSYRRALTLLERRLAPFVRETFGLALVTSAGCPICAAPWRHVAEAILDSKTAAMTWGQVARRLERAIGWRASTPQILIAHQKNHRSFSSAPGVEESFEALFTENMEET